ncbi:MAG: hypothetical protein QN123_10565 [Armatimonadota bacterium]|nr:hypothetical protein [Armatimonadota bacterium]
MKALQEHLNRWLLVYVVLAMAVGLGVGYPHAAWTRAHEETINGLTTLAVFLIIYPMMANLKIEALVKAGRTSRAWPWPCTSGRPSSR